MSQPLENLEPQEPDVNPIQQTSSSTPDNVVQGNDNRVIQGNGNKAVIGDNNTVIYGSNNQLITNQITLQEYRLRQILLSKVRKFWIKGVLEESLYQKAQIILELEERFDAVDLAWQTPEQSRKILPKGTKAVSKFDELGKVGTLLILGDPGSGKTTTLLEIGRELVNRAEQDVSLPIPVVFNLSSWAETGQSIAEWLIQELITKYQASKAVSKDLVKKQDLLLLLDGLDEVRAERREACVAAINKFSKDYGHTGIIVCSRIRDYEVLKQHLQFQSAIFVQPLTSKQIDEYLSQAGAKLQGVKIALNNDPVLQELAQTPLMLSIISLAYQRVSITELPKLGLEEQRKYLFDAYIRQMFRQRHDAHKYPLKEVLNWLKFLAKRMSEESQTIFLIERIQPNWLLQNNKIFNIKLLIYSTTITIFLIGFIIYSLHIIYYYNLVDFSLTYWFIDYSKKIFTDNYMNLFKGSFNYLKCIFVLTSIFLAFSPLVITKIIIEVIADTKIHSVETIRLSWQEILKSSVNGLRIALGIVSGYLIFQNKTIEQLMNDTHTNESYVKTSIVGTIIILLLFVATLIPIWLPILILVNVLKSGSKTIDSTVKPNQGIWLSTCYAIIFTLLPLICFYIITLLTHIQNFAIVGGLLSVVLGLSLGGFAAIQHFILRLVLYCSGVIPWNYAQFLNYTSDRLFLQKVGGGYIFVHRLLLEHFAQLKIEN